MRCERCNEETHRNDAEGARSYLVVRKSTVACRAVPLTACSGDSSWESALLLHRAVVERYRISIALRNACFGDGIAREGAKMMKNGPVALCDGNQARSRQENGRFERGQEYKNDAQEIQN
jgi:uncharacterized membrane protein